VTCVPLAVRLRVLLAEPRFIYRASSLPRTQLVVWPGMCLGRSSMALISLYIHQLTLFGSQTSVELSSCGGEVGCKKPLHAKKKHSRYGQVLSPTSDRSSAAKSSMSLLR
jgi:hypothetical protein